MILFYYYDEDTFAFNLILRKLPIHKHLLYIVGMYLLICKLPSLLLLLLNLFDFDCLFIYYYYYCFWLFSAALYFNRFLIETRQDLALVIWYICIKQVYNANKMLCFIQCILLYQTHTLWNLNKFTWWISLLNWLSVLEIKIIIFHNSIILYIFLLYFHIRYKWSQIVYKN